MSVRANRRFEYPYTYNGAKSVLQEGSSPLHSHPPQRSIRLSNALGRKPSFRDRTSHVYLSVVLRIPRRRRRIEALLRRATRRRSEKAVRKFQNSLFSKSQISTLLRTGLSQSVRCLASLVFLFEKNARMGGRKCSRMRNTQYTTGRGGNDFRLLRQEFARKMRIWNDFSHWSHLRSCKCPNLIRFPLSRQYSNSIQRLFQSWFIRSSIRYFEYWARLQKI